MDRKEAERLLGLEGDYDHAAVRRAFAARSKETHPDLNGDDGTAAFLAVKEARRILDDLLDDDENDDDLLADLPPPPPRPPPPVWRARQHASYDTGDVRSRAARERGLDTSVGLVAALVDGLDLDVTAWRARLDLSTAGLVLAVWPSPPLAGLGEARLWGILPGDGTEVEDLSGPVVERCHDAGGRVSKFSVILEV